MSDSIYNEIKTFREKIRKIIDFHDDFNLKLKNSFLIDDKIIEEDSFSELKSEELICDEDLSDLLLNNDK